MESLRDGLSSSVRAAADTAGAFFGRAPTNDAPAVHQKPPTPEWDAQPAARTREPERASYEGSGVGGAPMPFDRDDGAKSGKNNKYATSYSWDNPPPRPRDEASEDDEGEKAKEKTAEELFGMDKEPSKKLLKKRAARAKERGALHAAVAYGDLVDARELIENGAEVNQTKSDDDATTPLHAAAAKGNIEMVRLLLKHGADGEAKDDDEHTALHIAASKGHAAVVARLIKAGCVVDEKANHGATALHLAARKGHDDVVEALLESGVDIQVVDGKGATPLHAACSGGDEDVVALLLSRGADVAAVDGKGKTPRQIATKKGHDGCTKLIKRAIKDAEANALAAEQMVQERAQRAALKEAAEAKAALEAHGLNDIDVPPPTEQTEQTEQTEPTSTPVDEPTPESPMRVESIVVVDDDTVADALARPTEPSA